MALVDKLTQQPLHGNARHSRVECTYSVVVEDQVLHLQLDTYGSKARKIQGKKSQSIRLTLNAIAQLKKIFQDNGL